jgi:hypothetical protein
MLNAPAVIKDLARQGRAARELDQRIFLAAVIRAMIGDMEQELTKLAGGGVAAHGFEMYDAVE